MRYAVAFALVAGVLAGCPADPRHVDRRPVAVAGNVQLTQDHLLAVLAQRGVARVADKPARREVAAQILDNLIDEALLLAAAETASIVVTDEIVDREMRSRTEGYAPGMFLRVLGAEQLTLDAYRDSVRRRMTQDAFLRARMASLPPITDAEIEAAYQATISRRQRPAQVRARQVLVRTGEEATHIVEQIRSRKLTVEQAALRFSQGLEAQEGGDLGWFALGDLPKVFELCFILEPGVVSDPIQSEYGFHVFQVIEKREPRTEPLSAVRDEIFATLVRDQQATAADAIIRELRAQQPIRIENELIDVVVALLPEAPVTPSETTDLGTGRPLDSHNEGVDPIPPLRRE